MEADISSQAVGLATNTDFSLVQLFLRADIIVKSVMILLIVCSIYSWAIIIEKIRLFKKINISTEEFQDKFWKSKSAETFYNNIPKNIFQQSKNGIYDYKHTWQTCYPNYKIQCYNNNEKANYIINTRWEKVWDKLYPIQQDQILKNYLMKNLTTTHTKIY